MAYPPLFDICVNLSNGQFHNDWQHVVQRAWDKGVQGMALTSTDLQSTRENLTKCEALSTTFPELRIGCTAGIHPHDATLTAKEDALPNDWLDQLRELHQQPHIVAVGEMGLDYFRNFTPQQDQQTVFAEQLALAKEVDRSLFVHDRDASDDVLELLHAAGELPPTVVHCFTGTYSALKAYLARDCYIGITGWVSDPKRGAPLRELVPHIPLNRLLIETDAPFLKPANVDNATKDWLYPTGSNKRRNEPALLPFVVETLAELYQVAPEEIAQASWDNACTLFAVG